MVNAVQVKIQEQLCQWPRQAQIFCKKNVAHGSFVVIDIIEKRDQETPAEKRQAKQPPHFAIAEKREPKDQQRYKTVDTNFAQRLEPEPVVHQNRADAIGPDVAVFYPLQNSPG